jgi:hypothetical protein
MHIVYGIKILEKQNLVSQSDDTSSTLELTNVECWTIVERLFTISMNTPDQLVY